MFARQVAFAYNSHKHAIKDTGAADYDSLDNRNFLFIHLVYFDTSNKYCTTDSQHLWAESVAMKCASLLFSKGQKVAMFSKEV